MVTIGAVFVQHLTKHIRKSTTDIHVWRDEVLVGTSPKKVCTKHAA